MLEKLKNFFSNTKTNNTLSGAIDDDIRVLTLEDLKKHFSNPHNGFEYDADKIDTIKSKLDPAKKNIFILDDICEIVDILETDLKENLKRQNKVNKANIISMCTKDVGFDMLAILSEYPEISIDFLITDITFGGNKKINSQNTIIDGIDILLISKEKNKDLEFIIFTGNILTEANIRSYNFAKKFKKYTGKSIIDYTVIKDSFLSFNNEAKIFSDFVDKI